MERIFVPTRGRATSSKFISLCEANDINVTIVVEKEEADLYAFNFNHDCIEQLVLPESNSGITYARNFIKQYTENNNIYKFWMIDDDVNAFYLREGNKMIKTFPITVLEMAEKSLRGYAIGGLDYQQLAWSAGQKYINENSFCDVCVLIDNTQTFGIRYREYIEGKEDRDLAMQVIKEGLKTGRTTLQAFAAPANGSNEGGLKDIFYDQQGMQETCVDRMVELWGPQICTKIKKPNGRIDCKINWKAIKSPQKSLF